jgi:replicative DNA helicase
MDDVGGINYLSSLTNAIPSADNYKYYMDIVKKNSMLRQLIGSAQTIMDTAFSADPDDDALQLAEREIYSLAEKQERTSLVEMKTAVDDAVAQLEEINSNPDGVAGVPIEFKKLNAMLNGFHPTDLVVLGARPGEGKTSLGMNFITYAALNESRKTPAGNVDRYKCAVFSLEMSATQIANRMLCSVAKVDMGKANKGKLDSEEWKRIHAARNRLAKAQVYIDDNAQTTPVEILSKCRRLKREKGLDIVMVDYLQLMTSGKKIESRQQEVSEISRNMKIAAKELGVPIILLSQLSRDVVKRQDRTPQMSDLRESGAIEQDADIIMFIFREHDSRDETIPLEERNKAEIHIAKHRNGETGRVPVVWRGQYTTFEDVDESKATKEAEKNAPKGNGNFIMGNDEPDVEENDDEFVSLSTKLSVEDGDSLLEELNNSSENMDDFI